MKAWDYSGLEKGRRGQWTDRKTLIHALPSVSTAHFRWEMGVTESSRIQLLTQFSIPAWTLPFLLIRILKLSYGPFLWPPTPYPLLSHMPK